MPTDHVFHPISTNWITIAEYRKQRGLGWGWDFKLRLFNKVNMNYLI
jgi:hypothetical protein